MKSPKLAVVMPVYNEAGIVEEVVKSWTGVLRRLNIDWRLHLYDDGSKDNTLAMIKRLAAGDPCLVVHHHKNRGHGPTVSEAYQDLSGAEWIFQVDSDNEVPAQAFGDLWRRREEYDLLLGERKYEKRPATRWVVSAVSRWLVWGLFGRGMYDVNVPYRLMRTSAFRSLFKALPADMFSPNVIISGFAIWQKYRIYVVVVPYRFRQTGQVSIRRGKLLKAALKSFWQTIHWRFFILNKYIVR